MLRDAASNGTELTAGQLYSLHFDATGDRAFAERVARARLWEQLKAGQTPDAVS